MDFQAEHRIGRLIGYEQERIPMATGFELKMTCVGGPTALIELGGLRLLTDPTFDPAGSEYVTPIYTLRKLSDPAMDMAKIGPIDVVLLSHDHHFDNLDRAGRLSLEGAGRILTTPLGAQRLGGRSVGLANWESVEIHAKDGRVLRVLGTPARHGPVGGDRGPVTGFVLFFTDAPDHAIYVSGDTVWYEGVAEVARRYRIDLAVLFMGGARVPAVGPEHLTMTAREGAAAARALASAVIVPLHVEGWAHFSESGDEVLGEFVAEGLRDRLRWLGPGDSTAMAFPAK